MKTGFLLFVVALVLGYFAFEYHQNLELGKCVPKEKLSPPAAHELKAAVRPPRSEYKQAVPATDDPQKEPATEPPADPNLTEQGEGEKKSVEYSVALQQRETLLRQQEEQLKKVKAQLAVQKVPSLKFSPTQYSKLKKEIEQLEKTQQQIKQNFNTLTKDVKRLQCYDKCIRFYHVNFQPRQKSNFKTFGGVYSYTCTHPQKRQERSSIIKRTNLFSEDDKKSSCRSLHFTCSAHQTPWILSEAQSYAKKWDEYQYVLLPKIRQAQVQYKKNFLLLKKKKQALAQMKSTDSISKSVSSAVSYLDLNRQKIQLEAQIRYQKHEIDALKAQLNSMKH